MISSHESCQMIATLDSQFQVNYFLIPISILDNMCYLVRPLLWEVEINSVETNWLELTTFDLTTVDETLPFYVLIYKWIYYQPSLTNLFTFWGWFRNNQSENVVKVKCQENKLIKAFLPIIPLFQLGERVARGPLTSCISVIHFNFYFQVSFICYFIPRW